MKKIPLIKPQIDAGKLSKAIGKISQSGILTGGEFLATFEKKLADYLGVKYVLAASSGTAALHLALASCGIKAGDEVLVSDFSFPASANTIVQVGAKPVFVDILLDTYCLDTEDLKQKITSKAKAIMVVHAFGYPAEMSKIKKIAQKEQLIIIEDAACALGSRHKNKFCGTWGDVGCFSFHPRKNITTGEGGACVTNNWKMRAKIALLRNHGGRKKDEVIGMEFIENGFNYRLSELQAALGVEQMAHLAKLTLAKRKTGRKLFQALKTIPQISLPQEPTDGLFNWQSLVVLVQTKTLRDDLVRYLRKRRIESTLGAYAMHALKSFERFGYKPGDLKNSYRAYETTLALPCYGALQENEINYLVKEIKTFFKKS